MAELFIPLENVTPLIYLIRQQRVMLDMDLAGLYQVETRILTRAVKRNLERFPEDFMFQLTDAEWANLRSQIGISSEADPNLRSQIGTSKKDHGGRRYNPYVFSEQGVAMLSSVLRSKKAVQVNVQLMRAFVQLRQMVSQYSELAEKVEALEQKYDRHFASVFEAIRELMRPDVDLPKQEPSRRPIGFQTRGRG